MHKNLHLHALIKDNLILNPICITISSKVWLLCASTLNEHARYIRGWAAMKMAHAKLIHVENGGVALSLVFRYSLFSLIVHRWVRGLKVDY